MNCAVPMTQTLTATPVKPFCRPDPAGPSGTGGDVLTLPELAEVSGVAAHRINNWQNRGVWRLEPIGKGKRRAYTFWDALHLAIIVEMRSLGMQLAGRGSVLSEMLMECAKAHFRWTKDTSAIPSRIHLFALDDDDEWSMDWKLPEAHLPRSYTVINLQAITEEVAQRYDRARPLA